MVKRGLYPNFRVLMTHGHYIVLGERHRMPWLMSIKLWEL